LLLENDFIETEQKETIFPGLISHLCLCFCFAGSFKHTCTSAQPVCYILQCPFKASLAASPNLISGYFSAKTVPIYTHFQPFQTDTFNSSHCSYQGLSRKIKKAGRKKMDTAVSKILGCCDRLELSIPNRY